MRLYAMSSASDSAMNHNENLTAIEQVVNLTSDDLDMHDDMVMENDLNNSSSCTSSHNNAETQMSDLLSQATRSIGSDFGEPESSIEVRMGSQVMDMPWVAVETPSGTHLGNMNTNIATPGVSPHRALNVHGQTGVRTIAPKPAPTLTNIRSHKDGSLVTTSSSSNTVENNCTPTSTVLIQTSLPQPQSSSNVSNNNINANTVKALAKPIQMALVHSPDGSSVIAVPISALNSESTNRTIHIKPKSGPTMITIPSLTANSSGKAKSAPLMSGSVTCKVLPATLITSVSSSVSSVSSTATTSISIAPSQTIFNPTNLTQGFVTNVLSTPVATLSVPRVSISTASRIDASTSRNLSLNPPPLLSQTDSMANNNLNNCQSLLPPALTSVTSSGKDVSSSSPSKDVVKPKSEPEDESTHSEETSSSVYNDSAVLNIMEWNNGVGTLPGSDLKFKLNEHGSLVMVSDEEWAELEQKIAESKKSEEVSNPELVKQDDDEKETDDSQLDHDNYNDNENTSEKGDEQVSQEIKTCINCGKKGLTVNFIRQGKYCSKSCATIQSTHLRLFTKRNTAISNVKEGKKKGGRKSEKNKKLLTEKTLLIKNEEELVTNSEQNSNDVPEVPVTGDANEDVEDVESFVSGNNGVCTENGTIGADNTPANFSWRQYLSHTNSMAAPVKCFRESQTFPTCKNGFKVGMKLEGVDPQHPAKFCVLSVAEICGYRLRLHFDGYKEVFDFWLNADSPFIFYPGWCAKTNRKLDPPLGMTMEEFNWNDYLQLTKKPAAPKHLFRVNTVQQPVLPNGFRTGMKLEAVDRANAALVCVATIADIIDNWLLIHFDGWDDSYDYWAETTSPFIHAVNWCRTKGRSLTPPKDYNKSSASFSWEDYLQESKSLAVSPRAFKTRPSNNFKAGMKLEVVDKRNSKIVRVATIAHRQSHSIKIHFDGWDEKYDYWVDDDSPDSHPVNWCHKTDHPLMPPPEYDISLRRKDESTSCPTKNCNGIGHIRGPKYSNHHCLVSCPYVDSRLDYDPPDRLGKPPGDDTVIIDDWQDASPSTSEANTNSLKSWAKRSKSKQFGVANKRRKIGNGMIMNPMTSNGRPISPSTNSESAKCSRSSTPSSLSAANTLQQTVYALRVNQRDAPSFWNKHAKTALPGVELIKPSEVFTWSPIKVSQFIDCIPGCNSVGQMFQDEQIDGEAFLLLNQTDMVKILGVKLGPAIKIYNSILVIRENVTEEDTVMNV